MEVRPKQLAAKYRISANTLRNYEAKGLIPPAERTANGYRLFTERHEAYLACLQAMAAAFGMEVAGEVLHRLQRNELDDALWIVRDREVALHGDKTSLDQLANELKSYAEGSQACNFNQSFSIREASRRTGASRSAIRYWEKSGLFAAGRAPDNDYRLYNEAHLVKIRMIQVLQGAAYSAETVNLKHSIALLDPQNIGHARKLADRIQAYLNKTITLQMRGIYFLQRLIDTLD
ncbi:MerR family transcriptional regulator [Paenibacillus cymbidii]|uniref:MerR family transcriptional regulator n=1 Tax=Paenibacillus cymbidii TaxID=1639034 RepID=UPI001082106D|nr:MerR family transcriptional regulator [Paenibacillus cymbidii]